jgi:hypothetical protein
LGHGIKIDKVGDENLIGGILENTEIGFEGDGRYILKRGMAMMSAAEGVVATLGLMDVSGKRPREV